MDASQLVDEIVDALNSHPDEFWGKRAAVERVRQWLEGETVDCPYCGAGVGLLGEDAG